jgi:hypothetical protein
VRGQAGRIGRHRTAKTKHGSGNTNAPHDYGYTSQPLNLGMFRGDL